jgi:MFS family permease
LRVIQGLCLGGQYGGAITYVAEHVSDERRGFNAWAWRIPFLFSFVLVLIALYMRANFQESPIYAEIKAKGATTKDPWREAFLSANIKYVLIATIVVLGQGVVWYSGQFWALYFLQQVSKVDNLTTAYIVGAGLIPHRPQAGDLGRYADCGCDLLSPVPVARFGHTAWQYQHADCDHHSGYSGRLCRDGLRPDRCVSC